MSQKGIKFDFKVTTDKNTDNMTCDTSNYGPEKPIKLKSIDKRRIRPKQRSIALDEISDFRVHEL